MSYILLFKNYHGNSLSNDLEAVEAFGFQNVIYSKFTIR